MARRNDSWGIEVGANAIKAMRLARSGKEVELLEYDVLPFKQVLTTPDLNADEAIQVNLDALLSKHDLSRSNVVISVPGHLAFARFAKLPPVEPKKIPDIVRFEAVQQIPFPIDQVEWDYQVFQQEDSPDVEVGIFAITKERVMNFLANYRQVGMNVDALTLSPLAVYNAFAYDSKGGDDTDGTIYMDIGTQSTDLIIVESGGIWLRTLPIGGNNFTEALVKAFKLSFSKAEKLKKEAGTSKYARQIFQAMRPVFADLVQEMQRSLGYYQSLNRDAELNRLVGVGSTFRLPGLQKFLKQQLQMEVVRPDGFRRLNPDDKQAADFAEKALNMATAYGLALQGLGMESVSANILPQHILQARLWKAKQPWIAAAAASVAVAAGLAGGRYFMERNAFNEAVAETQPAVQRVTTAAQSKVQAWDQILSGEDPRRQIENLRRVLDYRDLWPKILQDISLASAALQPQPALLSADYDAIQSIPPAQRNRLYIEGLDVRYIPEPDPEPGEGTGDPAAGGSPYGDMGGMGFDIGMGMGMGMGPGAGGGGDASEKYSTSLDADQFFQENRGPRFEVTLTATTPRADAERFISQNFIGWLRNNAQQPDRPYRIIVPRQPIVRRWAIEPAVDPMQARTNGRSSQRAASTRRPTRSPGGMPAGMPPEAMQYMGDMGMMGPETYGGYGGGGQAMRSGDLQTLFPERPRSDEQVTRTGFEIRWTIELVRPEAARRAEAARAQPGAAPAPVETSTPAEEEAGETQPGEPAPQAELNPAQPADLPRNDHALRSQSEEVSS